MAGHPRHAAWSVTAVGKSTKCRRKSMESRRETVEVRGKPSENRGKLPTVKSCLETVEMRGKAPGKCAESRWKTAGDAEIPAAFAYPCPNAEGREANGKRKRVSFTEWDLVCHFPIRTVTHS